MVTNAAWGLGKAIDSGALTPDTLTVEKATGRIISREIAEKEFMTVWVGIGTKEVPVPGSQKKKAVLTDAQAAPARQAGPGYTPRTNLAQY
jgi:pyruvate,water dikinase